MFPASLLCKMPRCFRQPLGDGELGSHEVSQIWHSRSLSRTVR